MRVLMGNVAALEKDQHGKTVQAKDGKSLKGRVCELDFPPDENGKEMPIGEAFITITDRRGHWSRQSLKPPAWVESDNETLEQLLAEHYGCSVGKADGFLDITRGEDR